jgi:hypothetical protein
LNGGSFSHGLWSGYSSTGCIIWEVLHTGDFSIITDYGSSLQITLSGSRLEVLGFITAGR